MSASLSLISKIKLIILEMREMLLILVLAVNVGNGGILKGGVVLAVTVGNEEY